MVKLIIITACYSEIIAEKFKEKLPDAIVIAINKNLPVRDQAATKFSVHFYDKLLGGKTIQQSFDSAKKCLRTSFRNLACCCHHIKTHEKDCIVKKNIEVNQKIYEKNKIP